MAFNLEDRARETSTTTGTGAITLAGAVAGFRAFAAGIAVGDTTWYAIVNTAVSPAEFEVGIGTLSAATTLQRTQVLRSSNAGSAVNFSAGTKDVFVTVPADLLQLLEFAEVTIASAATTDIGALNSEAVVVTGTTAITSFGTRANKRRFLRFTDALTLTAGAALILPGGQNLIVRAAESYFAVSDGSGVWRILPLGTLATAAEIQSNTGSRPMPVSAFWEAHAVLDIGSVSGTVSFNLNANSTRTLTLTGNLVLANPTGAKPGQAGEIVLTQDGTGGRTVSYGSAWKFVGGTPTASTAANAVDVISYRVISSTLIIASFGKGVA